MVFSGAFDSGFIELIMKYEKEPSEILVAELIDHDAAIGVYEHAIRFNNTTQDPIPFWKSILDDVFKNGLRVRERIESSLQYLKKNDKHLIELLNEVAEFLPTDINVDFKIHGIVGYDIGIVSKGNAFLNLAAKHYEKDRRELLYFAMHESHHVGYTHYNPIYSFSTLNTTGDLLDIVRYSTHLEGLATYVPLQRRRKDNGLEHQDYATLVNPERVAERCSSYWTLLEQIENEEERRIEDKDDETIERMSGRNERLWYIAGAEMCRKIDEKIGRDRLRDTVKKGPLDFFRAYEEAI